MEKKKILVIDRKKLNRKILQAILEDDYFVTALGCVGDIPDAKSFNIDYALVIINAADLLEKREITEEILSKIPMLIISKETDPSILEELHLRDDVDLISEPFVPEIVLHRVSKLIRLSELTDRNTASVSLELKLDSSLMNSKTVNLFWKDADRRFVGANQKFLETYGFSDLSAILGKTDEDMGWHVDEGPFMTDEWRILKYGEVITNHIGNCIIQGVAHNILVCKEPLYDGDQIIGLVGMFIRIDDILSTGNQAPQIDIKDQLTGLMSTHGLTNMISQYAEGYATRGENFAVIRITAFEDHISSFTFGEKSAKQILIDMSRMIRDIFGRDGTCARLYAGNFVVLIKCTDKGYVRSFSNQLQERLNKLNMLSGYSYTAMTPAIRIYFADEAKDLRQLMALAYGGDPEHVE